MSAPITRKPSGVPDLRLYLREQWRPGGPFHRTVARTHCVFGDPDDYARWEHRELGEATLWWVAADMVEVLMASAPSVPSAVRLPELPCPSDRGFVVFERPWCGSDSEIPGGQVQVDALMWGQGTLPPRPDRGRPVSAPAVGLSTYRRLHFDDGLGPDELQLAISTGAIYRVLAQQIAVAPGIAAYTLHGCQWLPLGRSEWPVGEQLGDPPLTGMPEQQVTSYVEDRKILAALWTLLAQDGIATTDIQRPERQAVRRTIRAGLAEEVARVRVVTVRRNEAQGRHDGFGGDRDWSHRWLVSGHWRHQPVGHGRRERRLTWVKPHVKGPADKPLVVKETVHALRR